MGDILADRRGRISRLASSHDCASTAVPYPKLTGSGGMENPSTINMDTLRTVGGPQDIAANSATTVDTANVLVARAEWLEEVTPAQRFWSPA